MPQVRIQKLLSDAGVASRRAVEQMILDGRITVNGRLVAQLPCFVDPENDQILVDSLPVPKRPQRLTYLLANKPRGVACAAGDPQGRPSLLDMAAPGQRLLCIAPLDADSAGLVLLTNDGEMVRRLTHARSHLQRRYVVEADGRLDEHAIHALKGGVYLDARRTLGAAVKIISRSRERTMLEVDIVETRNRELRRIFARAGHKVRRLKRVGLGPLTDAGLKVGHVRQLMPHEVRQLQGAAGGASPHAHLAADRTSARTGSAPTRPGGASAGFGRRPGRTGGRARGHGRGHDSQFGSRPPKRHR